MLIPFGHLVNWLCFLNSFTQYATRHTLNANKLALFFQIRSVCREFSIFVESKMTARTTANFCFLSYSFAIWLLHFTLFAYQLYAIRYTLIIIIPKNRLNTTKNPIFRRKMSMTRHPLVLSSIEGSLLVTRGSWFVPCHSRAGGNPYRKIAITAIFPINIWHPTNAYYI